VLAPVILKHRDQSSSSRMSCAPGRAMPGRRVSRSWRKTRPWSLPTSPPGRTWAASRPIRRRHARACADRGRAPAVRRPGRRRAGGRRRPQDGDHGHRQRSARTV